LENALEAAILGLQHELHLEDDVFLREAVQGTSGVKILKNYSTPEPGEGGRGVV